MLGLCCCIGSLLVAAGRGCSALRCAGFSRWLLLVQSTGSRWAGSSSCGRLSSCGSQALQPGLSSCGTQAPLLRGVWNTPRPGIEPAPPALTGRRPSTVPPGKSKRVHFAHSPETSLPRGYTDRSEDASTQCFLYSNWQDTGLLLFALALFICDEDLPQQFSVRTKERNTFEKYVGSCEIPLVWPLLWMHNDCFI